MPRLLRDAQVLPIWEGTTNVLSLDTLRAIERTNALEAWTGNVGERLDHIPAVAKKSTENVRAALRRIEAYAKRAAKEGSAAEQAGARSFAFALARVEAGALLLEHAAFDSNPASVAAAQRWAARDLAPLVSGDTRQRHASAALAESD